MIELIEEIGGLAVDLGLYIAKQIEAAKAGTEAEAALALVEVRAVRAKIAGLRASEQADHDAAVDGG